MVGLFVVIGRLVGLMVGGWLAGWGIGRSTSLRSRPAGWLWWGFLTQACKSLAKFGVFHLASQGVYPPRSPILGLIWEHSIRGM